MKGFLQRSGLFVGRHRQLVIIVIVLLLAVLSGGAPEIDGGFEGG